MERQVRTPDHLGRVKFLNKEKGFGFIEVENCPDLFFSIRSVSTVPVEVEDTVCFHQIPSRKHAGSMEATNIRKVYWSEDSVPVFNRLNSHLHAGATALLGEVISKVSCAERDFIQQQISFDQVIGKKILVSVNESDDVVYAIRKGRSGHTKFVRNREPEDCCTFTLVLKKVEVGYMIMTAFIGEVSEPEPWDKNATEGSVEFWNSHALIYGYEQVLENSITSTCPWGVCKAA